MVRLPAALLRLAPDDYLVGQLRAGSDGAFEVLFDRHHKPLLAFCRHMLGSSAEAEDAVQETFLSAYRGIVRSSRPIAVRPWLYTIARHRCISILRGRREQPVEAVPERPTATLSADVDTREDLRALLIDLGQLPEAQRAALLLAELGHLPHEEIASVLGCPQQKVRALVFQARSNLAAARAARETPCREIREHIAMPGGGRVTRSLLRRHLAVCEGCREFRDEVRAQRRGFASLLPAGPALGVKASVLGTIGGGAGGGGAAAVSGGALLGGSFAATSLVAAAIVGGAPQSASPPDTRARDATPASAVSPGGHRAADAPTAVRQRSPLARRDPPARVADRGRAAPPRPTEPYPPRDDAPAAGPEDPPHGERGVQKRDEKPAEKQREDEDDQQPGNRGNKPQTPMKGEKPGKSADDRPESPGQGDKPDHSDKPAESSPGQQPAEPADPKPPKTPDGATEDEDAG